MGMKNDNPALEAITALGWETLEKFPSEKQYKCLKF